MKRNLLIWLLCSFSWLTLAQETIPINGIPDERPNVVAFTNGTIVLDHQTTLENATLLIKDGKVAGAGTNLAIPANAVKIDLKGNFIYPSFIDPHTNYGMPRVKPGGFRWGRAEQITSSTDGAYNANEAIKSEFNASEVFMGNEKEAEGLRGAGFGAVLTFRPDGVARGSSAFVTLSDETENAIVLKGKTAAHYAFDKGSSSQDYPFSKMGFNALLRQTFYDAEWYSKAADKELYDQSLEAWLKLKNLPQVFSTNDLADLLRADRLGDELGIQFVIKSGSDAYQRVSEVKNTNAPLIVSLEFPDAYDTEDPYEAMRLSLSDLKHWEMAPANAGILANNGIEFAFTADGLKGAGEYLTRVRKAVEYGLSPEMALKAMTSNPARFLKVDGMVGSLQNGKVANLIIASGNLFEEDTKLLENWIQGKRFKLSDWGFEDYAGKYNFQVGDSTYQMEISGKPESPEFKIVINDSTDVKMKGSVKEQLINLSYKPYKSKEVGDVRLSGWIKEKSMAGEGQLQDGKWISWKATYSGELKKEEEEKKEEKKEDEKEEEKPGWGKVIYPFVAFGNETLPQSEEILFKNATVWTSEADGVLQNTDVLVKDGKISKIGKDLNAGKARVIDATGKHLTAGIIDEHSHIALASVNDVAVNSGMVRMGDVIDPDDIDIYRQLSGGVTAAQLLHGSANPIGGQSALVKMRWGKSAPEMLIEGADGFIKFALGENVKRSSSSNSIRYPQTRMGVEQVYVDAFTRAQEYEKEWKAYNGLPAKEKANAVAPRRDLALDAMVEILNGKRFITCHSYVQTEINMLMKVAERFGFRVNTFTHILEGYKVADKMKEHGVNASTFSDWWAYKYEVVEAIPYNAAIMAKQGVTTAINSDDAEMGRRLNQEAAKTITYGDMSEEEALKMVTINPAKMLHLDDRMGSIKKGKDADLVLWSDHPLSIYAKAEKTMVDGVIYYDSETEAAKREAVAAEKARIIAKMRDAKSGGAPTQKPKWKGQKNWHCDEMIGGSVLED